MRIRSSCSDRKNLERPGITLAPGTATQLVIDAAAFVALGADRRRGRPAWSSWRALLLEQACDIGLPDFALRGTASQLDGPGLRIFGQFRQMGGDTHVGIAAQLDVGNRGLPCWWRW